MAVVGGCDDGHFLAALQMLIEAANIESLAAGQLQRCGTCSPLELKRQYAHADQIAAMDSLIAFSDHSADAEQ